jgi:Family of unknown function (DUF5995)
MDKSLKELSQPFRYTSERSRQGLTMAVAQADEALYLVVSGEAPTVIGDVIAVMERIDALLANDDGLKWFNRMYLMVTQSVDLHPPDGGWNDADWLLALDVVFAGFYLRAIAGYLSGDKTVPISWQVLMEARHTPGIDRIQFAVAGMNAHINHDLALALLATDAQRNVIPSSGSPQYVDYQAVNGLLNTLMPAELSMLATDVLGVLAQDTGKVGRLLAFWNICKARNLAWDFADYLRGLTGPARAVAMSAQDQMTGVLGRAILALN